MDWNDLDQVTDTLLPFVCTVMKVIIPLSAAIILTKYETISFRRRIVHFDLFNSEENV